MKILIYAIAVAMFFEGIPYLTFPKKAKEVSQMISQMSDEALRVIGGTLLLIGFLILYFV